MMSWERLFDSCISLFFFGSDKGASVFRVFDTEGVFWWDFLVHNHLRTQGKGGDKKEIKPVRVCARPGPVFAYYQKATHFARSLSTEASSFCMSMDQSLCMCLVRASEKHILPWFQAKNFTFARSSVNDPVVGLSLIEYAGVPFLLIFARGSMYAAGPTKGWALV